MAFVLLAGVVNGKTSSWLFTEGACFSGEYIFREKSFPMSQPLTTIARTFALEDRRK